ncbi:hypothetical protein [Nostoc sp.]|uniref:hypothetical protein n=1 Tax=Nostoc sp. TaxID=1180 RepID=UPI002FFB378C
MFYYIMENVQRLHKLLLNFPNGQTPLEQQERSLMLIPLEFQVKLSTSMHPKIGYFFTWKSLN